jgi:hypothetical protein
MLYSIFLHFADTSISAGNLPTPDASSTAVQTILAIAFDIIGALALLMVVVSGLRYILSTGDPQKTVKARDGIIYSLVGLAIAIAARAIIAFVVERL